MRLRLFNILLLSLFMSGIHLAQISYNISNTLRYGNGERAIGTTKGEFRYFENLTDIRLSLPYKITIGARALYDNPPEIGFVDKGLKRRFIELSSDNYLIRLGNFSELYGRGLALNLFENRSLGYDTWMDGVRGKYSFDNFNFSAIAGKLNFKDSIEIKRKEDYTIFGGGIEYNPLSNIKLGLAYIYSKALFNVLPKGIEITANTPSFYLSYDSKNISFLFDYSFKDSRQLNDNVYSKGRGIYTSISYTQPGIGITLDYKNYAFDERDPFERNDFTRPSRMLPFQNPPIVLKEHSYTLFTRAIHEVDFNDELGFQLEVFLTPSENSFLTMNASFASRHSRWELMNGFEFKKMDERKIIPGFSNAYSPYYEMFAELEYEFSDNTSCKIAAAKRSKILANEFSPGSNDHVIHSTILPFQLKKKINSWLSFETDYQIEFVNDNYNTSQQKFNNQLFSLIGIFVQDYTLTFRYEFTTNNYEVSKKRVWSAVEVGGRVNQNISFVIAYGSERGGQICSNGVCRYIIPFNGLRLQILTNL